MNLLHAKPLGHDAEHFHLRDARDGKTFKVAKKGLSKGLHEAIMQHFADGGDVLPETADAVPTPDPRAELEAQMVSPQTAALLTGGQAVPTFGFEGGAGGDTSPAAVQQALINSAPGGLSPIPKEPTQSAPEAVPFGGQPTQPQTQTPAPVMTGVGGSGPNIGKDLAGANKEAVAAQNAAAATANREAEALARAQEGAMAQRQAVSKEWDDRWKANQARADALARGIASSEIDPNHVYNSMSTGQKLGSAFAMILGGIGSGMTMGRQSNAAMDVINGAIARDMEAQKINLGKKESLLSHYVNQGHDIRSAQQLAIADTKDAAAAQLQLQSTKFMGAKADNMAAANISELHKQAAMERQAVFETGMKNTLLKLQVALAGAGQQQQNTARQAVAKVVSGQQLTPQEEAQLPKELAERYVNTAYGRGLVRGDKAQAAEVIKTASTLDNIKAKLQRYNAVYNNGHPTIDPSDKGTAEAIRSGLLAEMGHLHDLNRLTDVDLDLFKKQIPDVTDLFSAKAKTKLDELASELHDKAVSTNKNYLIGGSSQPTQNLVGYK